MSGRFGWVVLLALGLHVAEGTAASAQLEPAPRAPSLLARSGLTISTGDHYRSRVALVVTPATAESLLRVTTPDGSATTLSVSVLAFGRRSDATGIADSFAEVRIAALRKSDGSWRSQVGTVVASTSSTQPAISLTPETATGSRAALTITSPASYDLVTLFIELRASGAVLFEELF